MTLNEIIEEGKYNLSLVGKVSTYELRGRHLTTAHKFINSVLNDIEEEGYEMSKDFINLVKYQVSEFSTTTPTNPNYFRKEWKTIHRKIDSMNEFITKVNGNKKELQKFSKEEILKHLSFMDKYYRAYFCTQQFYENTASVAHIYANDVLKAQAFIENNM